MRRTAKLPRRRLWGAAIWSFGCSTATTARRPQALPVGSYRLFVAGKTHAAQSIPFEVRAGETTTVGLRARAGVRQRFLFTLPAKSEPSWGSLRILRGGELVGTASAKLEEGKPCSAEVCLDPGDYTIAAKFGEVEGAAAFTVGEHESEPVRVAMPQPR